MKDPNTKHGGGEGEVGCEVPLWLCIRPTGTALPHFPLMGTEGGTLPASRPPPDPPDPPDPPSRCRPPSLGPRDPALQADRLTDGSAR